MKDAKSVIEKENKGRKTLAIFMASEPGNLLLTELSNEFDNDNMVGTTVELTYFNLGARHVVRLLKNLRDEAQKE